MNRRKGTEKKNCLIVRHLISMLGIASIKSKSKILNLHGQKFLPLEDYTRNTINSPAHSCASRQVKQLSVLTLLT